jgi:hypothetical protein
MSGASQIHVLLLESQCRGAGQGWQFGPNSPTGHSQIEEAAFQTVFGVGQIQVFELVSHCLGAGQGWQFWPYKPAGH